MSVFEVFIFLYLFSCYEAPVFSRYEAPVFFSLRSPSFFSRYEAPVFFLVTKPQLFFSLRSPSFFSRYEAPAFFLVTKPQLRNELAMEARNVPGRKAGAFFSLRSPSFVTNLLWKPAMFRDAKQGLCVQVHSQAGAWERGGSRDLISRILVICGFALSNKII